MNLRCISVVRVRRVSICLCGRLGSAEMSRKTKTCKCCASGGCERELMRAGQAGFVEAWQVLPHQANEPRLWPRTWRHTTPYTVKMIRTHSDHLHPFTNTVYMYINSHGLYSITYSWVQHVGRHVHTAKSSTNAGNMLLWHTYIVCTGTKETAMETSMEAWLFTNYIFVCDQHLGFWPVSLNLWFYVQMENLTDFHEQVTVSEKKAHRNKFILL